MDVTAMRGLIERHLKAEGAGDIDGAVAVYTDDVVHDAVGFPGSPRQGKDLLGSSTASSPRTSGPSTKNRSASTSPTTHSCSSS